MSKRSQMPNGLHGNRVVIYTRCSTDKQDTSTSDQHAACVRYCEENNLKVVGSYNDEGISGDKTDQREAFKRMLDDRSSFDAILVWKINRFGRFNSVESGRWVTPLMDSGIVLFDVNRRKVIDFAEKMDRIMFGLEAEESNAFLENLSADVSRGMQSHQKQGRWVTGKPPFGYIVQHGTAPDGKRTAGPLIPCPEQAPVIQEMFERYNSGSALRTIADWLMASGIKTNFGNDRWAPSQIQKILRNPVYTGTMTSSKVTQSKYQHRRTVKAKGKFAKLPKDDWIVVLNAHPPIVERSLFDAVADKLSRNKRNNGPKRRGQFALTGMVRCMRCGQRMVGITENNERHLICNGYKFGDCERFVPNESEILRLALAEMQSFLNLPKSEEKLRAAILGQISKASAGSKIDTPQRIQNLIRSKQASIEQALNRLEICSDDMVQQMESRVRQHQADLKQLQEQLTVAKSRKAASEDISPKSLERKVRAARKQIQNLSQIVDGDYDTQIVRSALQSLNVNIHLECERKPNRKRSKTTITGGRIQMSLDDITPEFATLLTASSQGIEMMLEQIDALREQSAADLENLKAICEPIIERERKQQSETPKLTASELKKLRQFIEQMRSDSPNVQLSNLEVQG